MNKKIELGDKVKNIITGFEGVVTGDCQYLHGCRQFLVVPKISKNGEHRGSHWFDAPNLKVLKKAVVKTTDPTWGPAINPPPTGD